MDRAKQGFAVFIHQGGHNAVVSVEDAHFIVENQLFVLEERNLVVHAFVTAIQFSVLHMVNAVNGREVFRSNDGASAKRTEHLVGGALTQYSHSDQHEKHTHQEDRDERDQGDLHKKFLARPFLRRILHFFVLVFVFQSIHSPYRKQKLWIVSVKANPDKNVLRRTVSGDLSR